MKNQLWPVSLALIISLALATVLSQAAPAPQTEYVLEFVSYLGGDNNGVVVVGDYALTGFGHALNVLDISDPSQPVLAAQVMLPQQVTAVGVTGDYAYTTAGMSLRAIDISDPLKPTEVGHVDLPDWAVNLHLAGNYAYVVGDFSMWVINIADPLNPTWEGTYTSPGSWTRDVFTSGNYAYVAAQADGLRVVDISNPTNPQEVGSLDALTNARGVYVVGEYAYVTDIVVIESYNYSLLRVIDVSDPTAPIAVGLVEVFSGLLGDASKVTVVGDYAYVAGSAHISGPYWHGGVEVVDVSTPQYPSVVDNYLTPDIGTTYDVCVVGHHAFLTSGHDGIFLIVDISDPTQPIETSTYRVPNYTSDIIVSGDVAYVADWGITTIDVSNPALPVIMGYDTLSPPMSSQMSLRMVGNYAYIVDPMGGFSVMDISDPANPHEVGSCDWGGYGIDVNGSYAYVIFDDLWIVDISNPTDPQQITSFDLPGYAWAIDTVGTMAYAVGEELWVLDISDPTVPQQVGSVDILEYGYHIAVSGDYAYVAASSDGLRVVDVSDPANPQEVGACTSVGNAVNITMEGDIAYVSDGGYNGGLYVVDVSNPTDPVVVGEYDAVGIITEASYVVGDHAYLANGAFGLIILRIEPLALQVTPASVAWMVEAGAADPVPRTLDVGSNGRALTWTVTLSPTVSWLEVAPLSGTTPAAITATAHISGLSTGRYATTLVVCSEAGIENSPQAIPVTLLVVDEIRAVYLPLMHREP